MTFYLIGLGLDKDSISVGALRTLKECDKIYLENYTVDFPYSAEELEKELGIKVEKLGRGKVEDESIIIEAKEKKVALLVYGDCLSATTHVQLILACKEKEVDYEIFQNASIMTAVGQTGLQLYKFGKTASMPDWKEHKTKPTSFMKYVKDNLSIGAHTLILCDIGLGFEDALRQLKEAGEKEKVSFEKIVVVSCVGTDNQKIYFGDVDELKMRQLKEPFCFVILSEDLHFVEEDGLRVFGESIN